MKCATCNGKKKIRISNAIEISCPKCNGKGALKATIAEALAAKQTAEQLALAAAKSPRTLSVVVFGEPIPKGRPRFSARRGPEGKTFVRPYTPAETEAYEARGRRVAQDTAREVGWVATKADRFTVIMRIFRTHYDAGGDIDNYEKSGLDFLIPRRGVPGSGVIPDDRYIRGVGVSLKQDEVHPRLEVVISKFKKGSI